jgi:glutamate carboxypeptidase
MHDQPINSFFESRLETMLAELEALVKHESPSRDVRALDALATRVAERWKGLGGLVEIKRDNEDGAHCLGRFAASSGRPPALVLGHFDTVWPVGTLERMPILRDDGRLYGPGVLDMKASLAMMNCVLEAAHQGFLTLARPLIVLFTSDEEIGSPGSRFMIEALARDCEYVLVLEPALPCGGLKTSRKGVGRFTIEVEGKAAHAGAAPERGRSAILELAHQIIRIHGLNDPASGLSVNVGVIEGGTAMNVVPALASAQVDVRATSLTAAAEVERRLHALEPATAGTHLRVQGSFGRPPMERTPAIASLFKRACEIARRIGLELTEGSTGGGSDGNFTAALGVPTLDGLGAIGEGAHAENEHILISSFSERAALLAALLQNL